MCDSERARPGRVMGGPGSLGSVMVLRVGRRMGVEPLQALRESLEFARASGVDFDSAWQPSVERALTGYRGWARYEWSHAITATRDAWRSAYLGERQGTLERWGGELLTPA